jgi:putative transcriptional regulator
MIVEPIDPQKREWMKIERKKKGLTLKETADLLGCSYQHYHDIERGRRNPSIELSLKMANFFGVSIERFFKDRAKFKWEEN